MEDAFVYYRASREKQKKSGWGLEAQRLLIEDFALKEGYRIKGAYTEIASGSKYDRAVFAQASKASKHDDATLLIAYVDRLTRNLRFIIDLIESKIKFRIVTQPNAPNVVLEILAVISEDSGNTIREKTRIGLQAAKLHGVELGHNGHVLAKINRIKAEKFARHMDPIIAAIKEKGITSQRRIAKKLNRMHVPTYSGGDTRWHPTTVRMLLIRIEHERQRRNKQARHQNKNDICNKKS